MPIREPDDDSTWQDYGDRLFRLVIGIVAERSPLVADLDSAAGWALADLRSAIHDLLDARLNDNEEWASELFAEITHLLVEVARLTG